MASFAPTIAETYPTRVTFALCEVSLESDRWTLIAHGSEAGTLESFMALARTMNDAAARENPYVVYRVVDYATAFDRIRRP